MAKSGSLPSHWESDPRPYPRWTLSTNLKKSSWPGAKPEVTDEIGRLVDSGDDKANGVVQCSHGIAIELQPEQGVFGLVDLGDVDLLPDRSSVITKTGNTYSEARKQLMQGLVPRVREAMDGLEQFGSIPARHNFLRTLAARYGVSLLAGSSLRWIPTLEQPGNLIHRSKTELKTHLEAQPSVVICSGLSPGRAYDIASSRLDRSELTRSLEILLPNNEFPSNYEVEKRVEVHEGTSRLRGRLKEIIEKADCDKENFLLLGVLLDLVAEAWSVPRATLEEQQWEMDVDSIRGYLWGNLKRPSG